MKRSSSRTPSGKGFSLSSRLAAYSATAVAGLLAAPAVHATGVNITSANLFVNGVLGATPTQGLGAMRINVGPFSTKFDLANFGSTARASMSSTEARPGNLLLGVTRGGPVNMDVHAAIPGTAIAGLPSASFARGHYAYLGTQHNGQKYGSFAPNIGNGNTANGYLAFKLTGGATNYYGWSRVKIQNSAGGFMTQLSLITADGGGAQAV